ncbi:MAG: hypothetical protein RMK57_00055 [Bryobacterales bacterium]|nr:hypothetical protein [Bryobacteraceae bacterium]MDW8352898.1 hypothetical protein [Bryobacterales bacterium]
MLRHTENFEPEWLERQLDELFAAYRQACPDPEPTASFVPGVWRLIEGRREATSRLCRWAQAFVGAAALACLVLGLLLNVAAPGGVFSRATYVEALAEENPPEVQLYATAFPNENGLR